MRRVVVTEYLTLDGVMEAPNKWSFQHWNEEAANFKYEELIGSDALLLGRVTYEGFAAAWPTMEGTGDFGERMNSIPKYVVSTILKEAIWNNSTILSANIPEEVSKLKEQEGQDILVAGSADLVHTLKEHDLVDEYRFMIYPVVVGSGKRLFKDGASSSDLKLVNSKITSAGVVILTYEPDRK